MLESPGESVKVQMAGPTSERPIQKFWKEACESAFLANPRVTLTVGEPPAQEMESLHFFVCKMGAAARLARRS